jgi:hypothetical protein
MDGGVGRYHVSLSTADESSDKKGRSRAEAHLSQLVNLIARFPMVNPSSKLEQTPEQQLQTTEEGVDVVKLMTQMRAKYKVACATLGVRPRLVAATIGGDVVEGGAKERSSDGRAPETKRIWNFETAARTAGPRGLGF